METESPFGEPEIGPPPERLHPVLEFQVEPFPADVNAGRGDDDPGPERFGIRTAAVFVRRYLDQPSTVSRSHSGLEPGWES